MREAVAAHDDAAAGLAALTLADVLRITGRLHDAERWAAEAIAHLERRDPFGYLPLAYAGGSPASRTSAVTPTVAARRSPAIARLADAERRRSRAAQPRAHRGVGAAGRGRSAEAQAVLLEPPSAARSMPLYELSLRYEAMRAGAPAAALVARADALAARCDARLADCFIAHVRARAEQDAPELLRRRGALRGRRSARATRASAPPTRPRRSPRTAARTPRGGRPALPRAARARAGRHGAGRSAASTRPRSSSRRARSSSSRSRPAGSPTPRSPTGWCSRCAPSSRTSTGPCRSSASATGASSGPGSPSAADGAVALHNILMRTGRHRHGGLTGVGLASGA